MDIFQASGMDPNYDFYKNVAEQSQRQREHEQRVAEATERIKQARMKTKGQEELVAGGVNLAGDEYLPIGEAKAMLEANGVKQEQIDSFIEGLGDKKFVSRLALQAVIMKRGGTSGSMSIVGAKEGQPMQDEEGKWVRTWIKRTPELGILMTDRMSDDGVAVFKAEDPEGYATGHTMLSIQGPKLDVSKMSGEARKTMAEQKVFQNKVQNWKDLEKRIDPLTASGTSALALAGKANQRADRVFATLSDKDVTWPRIDAVVTDIAGIFQGGVPPIISLEDQDIKTWYQKLAKWQEFFKGYQATGLVPEELQRQLFNLTKEIKDIDNEIIRNQQYIVDVGGEDVIKQDPDRWERLKKTVLFTTESSKESDAYNRLFNGDKEAPKLDLGTKTQGTQSVESKKAALRAKLGI